MSIAYQYAHGMMRRPPDNDPWWFDAVRLGLVGALAVVVIVYERFN